MADKCIGRLTLDISDIEPKVNKINDILAKIGSHAAIKLNIADEVKRQIDQIYNELQNTATKIQQTADQAIKNIEDIGKAKIDSAGAKKAAEDTAAAVEKATQAYIRWQQAKTRVINLEQRGRTDTEEYARAVINAEKAAKAWDVYSNSVKQAARESSEAQHAIEKLSASQQTVKTEEIEKAIQAYIRWREAINNVRNLETKGQVDTEAYAKAVVTAEKAANAWDQYSESVKRAASSSREAQQAINKFADARHTVQQDVNTKEIEQATQAYIKMIEARAKLRDLETEGKQGTVEYAKIAKASGEAYDAFIKYSKAARDAAKASTEAKTAMNDLGKISSAVAQKTEQDNYLAQIKQKYIELTDAIKRYKAEQQTKNELGMATEQARIDAAMTEVHIIEQAVQASNMEAKAKQEILNYVQQCTTAELQHHGAIKSSSAAAGELEQAMMSVWTRMFGLLAVIRKVKQLITETVDYVSSYYDKMNEIQIITQKSSDEVEKLADDYMRIAEYMNVSSLDIADAAIYFTRQGLGAEEIERRLKNITMYAKTANVEFGEASELITAVVNSMGLVEQEAEDGRNAVQRVSDVFLNVGDHAATSGREIAEAMQKAAAAAGAFGLSFEWLASYIATVSETTRQEARTIGTAFNTIIARLHQIKQAGYNNEDTTKVNDIAKALSRVGIQLMDNNNEWRDMTVIFQELGDVWGTLDGKTKSYIATTMAGVKQQNVFLALMNDLGKKIDGNSRAWELYELAMNSAGTSEEKYATYRDSVAAAQERLNIAQEKFYSLLDASVIKGWYDGLAKIVTYITKGTQALRGLNIIIPITVGLIILVRNEIIKAGTASKAFAKIWESHPVLIVITAVAAAIFALSEVVGAFADSVVTSEERVERANTRLQDSFDRIASIRGLDNKIDEAFTAIEESGNDSSEAVEKYNGTLEELEKISPRAKKAVEDFKAGLIGQKEATEIANEELEKNLDLQKQIALGSIRDKYAGYTPQNNRSELFRYAENWDPSAFESTEALGEYLAKLFMNKGQIWDPTYRRFAGLPLSARDYISEQNQSLKDLPWEERWPIIGQRFWEHFFTEGNADSVEDIMQQEVESIIEDVYNVMSIGLDEIDSSILRKRLIKMFLGDDGKASKEEWENAGKKASSVAMDMFQNGFVATDAERITFLGESFFGDLFSEMFSPQEIEDFVARNPDIVDSIFNTYTELIKAGFTNEDIAAVLGEDFTLEQWVDMAELVKENIRNALDEVYANEETGESEIAKLFGPEYEKLDYKTLGLLNRLAAAEVPIEEIQEAKNGTKSLEEFIGNLEKLAESHEVENYSERTTKSISDLVKGIKTARQEIKDIDAIISKIESGEAVDIVDILGLSDAHPELLTVIGDSKQLLETLKQIRESKSLNIVDSIRESVKNNPDIARTSPFWQDPDFVEGQTLGEFLDTIEDDKDKAQSVLDYIENATMTVLASTHNLNSAAKDNLIAWENLLVGQTNMDFGNRKRIDAAELKAVGWEDVGEGYATLFSQSYGASATGKGDDTFAWEGGEADIILNVTPILPNGQKLSPEELEDYVTDLLEGSTTIDELFANDKKGIGDTHGILISVGVVGAEETFDEAYEREGKRMEMLHELEEAIYAVNDAEKSWLQTMVEESNLNAENEWAKSNGFVQQIGEMNTALSTGDVEGALAIWNSYDESMQKSIAKTYPELAAAMLNAEQVMADEGHTADQVTKAHNKLNTALSNSARYAKGSKAFGGTLEALQKLRAGTISATDAYEVFNKELDVVSKAGEDIADVQAKIAAGTDVTANDVSNLAKVLGLPAEAILADFPAAVAMFDELTGAGGELINVFDELNKAAFIRITGTSEADFSNIQNGLISVQNMSRETIDLLTATGQWKVETVPVNTRAWVRGEDGSWTLETLTSNTEVLVPTGNNPFGGRKSGGSSSSSKNKKSGSGGGSNRNNQNKGPTEIEKMLDVMSQSNSFQEYQKGYYSSQQNYFSGTGQLQGVIKSAELEKSVIEGQSKTLEGNISRIEELMAVKRKELAQMSESDEKYAEVAGDLDKLQKAHQNYTQQLIENNTRLNELNETIDEQRKKIRQMEIDIRNLIYKAIEDREKKKKDMLNAEVEMENKILDIIKRRYEKERDQLIDITNKKIDALREERDLLSEQLQLRKEQAEEEDKQKRLQELELQYQRISADPTRAKEAKKIQEEINALREEMAWDAAEKEVEAQQKSIDQQINSLEDYIDYVNSYYEELFNNPKQLIKEMKEVMSMTDDEIIEWLKANDEEYAIATTNRRKQMVESWENTLDTMRGTINTYWEEVEEIIKKGDDYIINFLKENSAEYAQAGKLQAEAFVEEWKEKLENLKKAHEQVAASIAQTYTVIPNTNTGSGGSSGGGGGSGSGSGNNNNNNNNNTYNSGNTAPYKVYGVDYAGRQTRLAPEYNTFFSARSAARKALGQGWRSVYIASSGGSSNVVSSKYGDFGKAFKNGGLADYTGPAWVDGTKGNPEAVLNPYQTKLFQTMVSAMEQIASISVPTMPNYGGLDLTATGTSVGDIIVNVDNLDTDDDYETLAKRVSDVLMERIGRTTVVGGLRTN